MEARSADAADPLHWDAPPRVAPSPAEGGTQIAAGTFAGREAAWLAGRCQTGLSPTHVLYS